MRGRSPLIIWSTLLLATAAAVINGSAARVVATLTALGENRLHIALETDGHRDRQGHCADEDEKNSHALDLVHLLVHS